jgi:hypothetical protein
MSVVDRALYGFTVRVVESEMLPEAAVIVVVPAFAALARPVLLMVATAVLEEVHVTPELMSETVPSLKKPVAANCSDPWATVMDGFCGVI